MVCPSCGTGNPDDRSFCGQCGRTLHVADPSQAVVADGPAATQPVSYRPPLIANGLALPPPSSSQSVILGTATPPSSADTLSMPVPSAGVVPTSLPPGTAFGTRYRIESLLGQGGMGAVYKAYDADLGRTVALKLIRPELATNPQAMQRFKQELLLASKISHKNILRIHDLSDFGGVKFITMAFVEGGDLAGLIKREGRLPFDRALTFTRQLCAALEAAHNEDVVHRDLKPQNILIDRSDNLYVSDFGLAKSLEAEATVMTRTGQVLGTPRYMSPEQVETLDVDHRADIYSLGLIVYEMLTADIPFRGESAMQIMYQRVNVPAKDPRTIFPEVPDYLATIILKCLEKDPAKRYQRAREILTDLDAQCAPAVSSPLRTTTEDAVEPAPKPGALTISIVIPKPRSRRGTLTACLLLAIGLAFAIPVTRNRVLGIPKGVEPGHPKHSLAVLPAKFVGDDAQKYLADGVVEALAAKLAGLKDVYVTSVGASDPTMSLKDNDKIAKSLGVTLLVRTSVTIASDQISIIVAMDSVGKQGGSLLKREADGSRGELLTLENKVFIALVSALQIAQSKEELARTRQPTDTVDAYDFYLRGRTLLRGKRTSETVTEALGLFEEAIKRDPRFALAFTGKADASLAMYNITKDDARAADALQAAQTAEGFNDALPEVYYSLLSISAATGKFEEALAYYKHATALTPNSDEGLRRLAEAYRAAHRSERAIALLEDATRLNKSSWRNWNQLGRLYSDAGQYDKALNAYSQVTVLAPDLSTGWLNLGVIHFSQGKWSECLGEYEKAIKLDPKALYYSNRGVAYFFLGRYAESATDFEQAVKMSPKEAGYHANLADAYRWSNRKLLADASYDEAIKLAAHTLQVSPDDTDARGIQALAYAKTGNRTTAWQLIGQARKLNANNIDLMYAEASIHALAGRTTEAVASLRNALQHHYSLDVITHDPELAELRKTPEFSKMLQEFLQKPAK
jgi:eukaryotic-like serine/threonine-protein kinase